MDRLNLKNLFLLALHVSFPYKANRQEWWFAHVVALVVSFVLGIFPLIMWETLEFIAVVGLLPRNAIEDISLIVEIVLITLILVPLLYTYTVASIKRLHDLGHSGWWWILNFLVVTIPFFILYLGFSKSKLKE